MWSGHSGPLLLLWYRFRSITEVIFTTRAPRITIRYMGQLSTSLDQDNQREIVHTPPSAAFDLRFILTEPEWREGTHLLHPIVGTSYTKPWIRLFWGICAIIKLHAAQPARPLLGRDV